jgi:ATP-dependent DNA helicase RecG
MTEPLSLRELSALDVAMLKGVDRRLKALREFGIETIFDLLTFYPRRWVDRTNLAGVRDIVVLE